jgi:hypothetical protein
MYPSIRQEVHSSSGTINGIRLKQGTNKVNLMDVTPGANSDSKDNLQGAEARRDCTPCVQFIRYLEVTVQTDVD